MKLNEIMNGLEILHATADLQTEISGISYDSRSTAPGDLFVAVVGTVSDGHTYIEAAVKKGAIAVICEKAPECNVPYLLVPEKLSATSESR